jgi:hypothetical protein
VRLAETAGGVGLGLGLVLLGSFDRRTGFFSFGRGIGGGGIFGGR